VEPSDDVARAETGTDASTHADDRASGPPAATVSLLEVPGVFNGLTHPLFCQNKAARSENQQCQGESTCGCSIRCTTSDHLSWGWDPQCCACHSAGTDANVSPEAALLLVTASLAKSRATTGLRHPSYCQDLSDSVEVSQCQGEATCACQSYCSELSSTSLRSDVDCCGCAGAAL